VIPGGLFIVGATLLLGYMIDKTMELTIEADLKERRK
jgi:hypothetical protein